MKSEYSVPPDFKLQKYKLLSVFLSQQAIFAPTLQIPVKVCGVGISPAEAGLI